MAVPKKKRYKQVVKSRRSNQKINLILKKNLYFNKFFNYVTIDNKYIDNFYCLFCKNNEINKKYCLSCLYLFHHFLWRIEAAEKRYRTRDLTMEYYVKLAKRLRLAHLNWINQ